VGVEFTLRVEMTPQAREPTLDIGAIDAPTGASRTSPNNRLVLIAILALEAALLYWGLRASPWPAVAVSLGCLFLLIAYRWPHLSTALVFAAAPLSFQVGVFGGSFIAVPTEPMIFLALTGRAVRAMTGQSLRVGRLPLIVPLAAYGGATLLSCFTGEHLSVSLKGWLVLVGYSVFGYVAFADFDWSPKQRALCLRVAATVVAIVAAYGVVRSLIEGVSSRFGYGIARPFFAEHGTYSAYLSLFVPWLMLEALDRRSWSRVAYAAAFWLVLAAVVLSFTRAAWLSLAIVLPATLLTWSHRKRSVRTLGASVAWAAVFLLVVFATGLGDRLTRHALTIVDTENVSNLERVNRWMAGWEMARAHQWTGVGYESFSDSYPSYRRKVILTQEAFVRMGVHNEALRALSEAGLLGLLAGAWLVWAIAAAGLGTFRRSSQDRSRMALGITAGLGTYFVHGWLNAYPGSDKLGLAIWMAIGAVAALSKSEGQPTG
jgi:O-antigen ligase